MFDDIRFGDFISIELKLKEWVGGDENIELMAMIYCFIDKPDYSDLENIYNNILENVSISDVINRFNNYLKWRQFLWRKYENYFGSGSNEEENQFSFEKSFDTKTWIYHLMTDKLVKELNMKPSEVWDMNVNEALQWLMMYKEKEEYLDYLEKKRNKMK
jgi:hypothetical protein